MAAPIGRQSPAASTETRTFKHCGSRFAIDPQKFHDYWFSGCVRRARARFETARYVIDGPHCITFVERITAGEERWHAIGSLENIIIIVAVHTRRRHQTKSCASSQPAVRHGMKEICMPKLKAEKKKELQRLAARPDREIDLSDIREIREFPSDALIGKFCRPKKASVTIRIDADVLALLRSSGKDIKPA